MADAPRVLVVNTTNEIIRIPLIASLRRAGVQTPVEELVEANGHGRETVARAALNRLAGSRKTPESPEDHLVIEAGGALRIDRALLELYAYRPLEDDGTLEITPLTPTEPITAAKIVTNKTARRIGIRSRDAEDPSRLVVAPFGKRRISYAILKRFDHESWEQLNLISVSDEVEPEASKEWWLAPFGVLTWGWVGILVLKALGVDRIDVFGLLQPGVSVWWLWPAAAGFIGLVAYLIVSNKGERIRVLTVQTLNLLLLLVLGPIGLPILVGLFFGGLITGIGEAGLTDAPVGLLGRGIQIVFIALLAALPGLLYFQFERRQEGSLQTRFIRDIMMINPCIQTEDDARAMYGGMIDEVSVAIGANNRQFSMFSAGRPILLATLLITIGWIVAIWPVGPIDTDIAAYDLLLPRQNPVVFAFLGAYLFALGLVFRRYARGDLTPKAYSHITVRILSSVILVWVASLVIWGTTVQGDTQVDTTVLLLVVAFGVGIVPETGIALLKDVANKSWLGSWFPSLAVEHPIADLEGISLYDQARLLEEGVESVENLAHHNLIELMLQSGIPTPRLVDLADQAILYLHVAHVVEETSPEDKRKRMKRGIHVLRDAGIRTATDLLRVVQASDERIDQARRRRRSDPERLDEAVAEREGLFRMLDPDPETIPHRMQIVLDAMEDDEWLEYVRNWRALNRDDDIVTDPEAFYSDAVPSSRR